MLLPGLAGAVSLGEKTAQPELTEPTLSVHCAVFGAGMTLEWHHPVHPVHPVSSLAPRLTVGGFFIPESPRFDPWLKSVLRWERIGEKECFNVSMLQSLVQLCRTDFDSR